MSNTGIIAIVVGAVAIALLALYRSRLTGVSVKDGKRRIDVSMDRPASLPEGGARQDGIDAVGNVTARDKTGVGASQRNVRSGGEVTATVESPPSASDPKKALFAHSGDASSGYFQDV